jgi:PAS domain S-box-containing protein
MQDLANLLAVTEEMMLVLDGEGRVLVANPAFLRSIGVKAAQVEGRSVSAWMHPDDWASATAAWKARPRGPSLPEQVIRVRSMAGTWLLTTWRGHLAPGSGRQSLCGRCLTQPHLLHPSGGDAEAEPPRSMPHSLTDVVFTVDQGGTFLDVHAPNRGPFHAPAEAFLGKHLSDIWPLDLADLHLHHGQQALQTGHMQAYGYQMPDPQGKLFDFEARVIPLPPARMLYVVRDISEVQQITRQLIESRNRLSLVIESVHIGLWDWDIGEDTLAGNKHWYTMLGYTPLEGPVAQAFWRDRIHPRDLPDTLGKVQQWLQGETAAYDCIYRLQGADGSYRWIHAKGQIVDVDEAGRPKRAVGVHLDISEQKEAELALRHQGARLIELLKNFPNGSINVLDRDYRYLLADGQGLQVMGLTSQDLVGKRLTDLFPPEQAQFAMSQYDQVFEQGKSIDFILHLSPYTYQLTAAPLEWEGGAVSSIVAVARDITEQQQAQATLTELNASLEQQVATRTAALTEAYEELASFSYSVSHDLRAPLRAITSFGTILQEDHSQELSPEGRGLLDIVITNGSRMGQLIDDILAYSRISRREHLFQPLDMTQLVREVYDEQRLLCPERQIDFHLVPLRPALGDPTMIRQVLSNLISNAIKYSSTRKEARIEVGEQTMDAEHVYVVRDNGVGFNQTHVEKIFAVFQRLHKASEFEGTGVGMAIARRVISQHGGRIWAEGQRDVGATFFFTLPAPPASAK